MNRPTTLTVLIVDDEPAARRLLGSMLAAEPNVEVVGECRDGGEAVSWLEANKADVVFLDVRMPRLDGFQVIAQTKPEALPPIVFVTAYDEFALRAFGVQAWDYLLKPFDSDRLRQTLQRVRVRLAEGSSSDLSERLSQLLEGFADRPLRRVTVRKGKARLSLKVEDLDWIEAESNYARLHTGEDSYLTRTSLAALEAKLDPRLFVRIHRSTIVNIDRVERLEPIGHGDLELELTNGRRLQVSRRYRERLESVLEPLS